MEGFDDSQFQTNNENQQDRCMPVFYTRAVEDVEATKAEGCPKFKEVPFVQILIPGNNKDIVDRAVKNEDKERWPRQWAAYQNQEDQPVEGTPLAEWPAMRPAQIAQLNAMNVRTVEQVAEASDAALQSFGMGARDLQRKAQAYLDAAKDSAYADKMAARIEALEADNEALREEVKQLKSSGGKKKRGRPKKQEQESAEV